MNSTTLSRITALICLSAASFCSRDPDFYVSAFVLVAAAFACLFVGYTDRLTLAERIVAKIAAYCEDQLAPQLMNKTNTHTTDDALRVVFQEAMHSSRIARNIGAMRSKFRTPTVPVLRAGVLWLGRRTQNRIRPFPRATV